MKKALIIIAHGSRLKSANSETLAFVEAIRGKISEYDEVSCAFLEFTKPNLMTSIESLAEKGIKEIVIFPYFLSGGSHLRDIKESVYEAEKTYINIRFSVTAHMGALPYLDNFITKYLDSRYCL